MKTRDKDIAAEDGLVEAEDRGSLDPKRRFSDRVADYVRYRPSYPAGAIDFLRQTAGFNPDWVVADIGSGTGISSKSLLDNGNTVFGVEPNAEMRTAAEQFLAGYSKFTSFDGSAEATELPDASVDMVLAGQAFHWFNPAKARAEFLRILRPGRPVVLMWNTRRLSGAPFLEGYERLLVEHGTDYLRVRHEDINADQLRAFYGAKGYQLGVIENRQDLDREGVLGRLRSASYVPVEGKAGHAEIMREASKLFDRCAEGGRVRLVYDTQIYVGALSP